MYLRHKIHLHVPNNFRKRKATPVLAYLILEALSMIMWAVLIVLILIGLQEADQFIIDLTNEDAAKIARTATTAVMVGSAVTYGLWTSKHQFIRCYEHQILN